MENNERLIWLEFKKFTDKLAEEYFDVLVDFYFDNISSCQFLSSFTREDAENKIKGFVFHLSKDAAIAYGCFDENCLCGYIWAYEHQFRDEKRVYISEIRIKEEYRKLGLGSKLIDMVESSAKDMGVPAIYIHAEANNEGAIRLYQRQGFSLERIQLRKEIV